MEKVLEKQETGTVDHESCNIVVFNDDFNSFEHVIDCFQRILKHSHFQAEQLALIIHTKGKAQVKHGTFEELRQPCEQLIHEGLDATIE